MVNTKYKYKVSYLPLLSGTSIWKLCENVNKLCTFDKKQRYFWTESHAILAQSSEKCCFAGVFIFYLVLSMLMYFKCNTNMN